MQKIAVFTAIIALVFSGLAVSAGRVWANDAQEQQNELQKQQQEKQLEQSKHDAEQAREAQKKQDEIQKEMEDQKEEHNINEHLNQLGNLHDQVKVDSPDMSAIVTYGDVIQVLQTYQAAISKIGASSSLASQLSPNLSDQENALLNLLLKKHKSNFDSLSARTAELNSQIQSVIDALQPMASQTISEPIKKLLEKMINEFHDQIEKLTEFADLDNDLIDSETF